MELFLEVSLVGLAVGGVYALVALGYVLVYRATRVVNFAHGNIMMVGAYLFFTFAALLGLPWGIALALTLLAAALLGAGLERGLLRPLLRRQRSEPTAALMATFGLAFALHGMVQIVWTSTDFFLPSIFPDRPIVIAAAHGAMYIPRISDKAGNWSRRDEDRGGSGDLGVLIGIASVARCLFAAWISSRPTRQWSFGYAATTIGLRWQLQDIPIPLTGSPGTVL